MRQFGHRILFSGFQNVIVMDEFETLHEKVNNQREFYKLKVIHGGVYYANKIHYSEVDPLDEFENDPMTKLKRLVLSVINLKFSNIQWVAGNA